eukprot:5505056-Amphidinium_carterae.1
MRSPAADITSRYKVTINQGISDCRSFEACNEFGWKRPNAPARCPKERPCAKTVRMAKDCHKTWHSCQATVMFRCAFLKSPLS